MLLLLLWSLLSPAGAAPVPSGEDCDLHRGACQALVAEGGTVSLRIEPLSIPLLDELQVEVRLEGIVARSVEVQFSGIDVDMGLLRYPMTAVGEGVFRGPAWLSVCSQRRMIWQAMVLVDDGRFRVPFRFETEYRRGFSVLQ